MDFKFERGNHKHVKYKMSGLSAIPKCEIESSFKSQIENREKLYNCIENTVGADCWAIVVDNEVIYDTYSEMSSYKEFILQDSYRSKICKNPRLIVLSDEKEKNHDIKIYMFGDYHHMYNITYNSTNTAQTTLRVFMSKMYYDKYGDDFTKLPLSV